MKHQTDEYITVPSTFQTTLERLVFVPGTFKNMTSLQSLPKNHVKPQCLLEEIKKSLKYDWECLCWKGENSKAAFEEY